MPHSPAGQRLPDKAGGTYHICPWKPVSLTLGSQSALMMAISVSREDEWHLLFSSEEPINPTQPAKRIPCCLGREGPPGFARNQEPIILDLRPGAIPSDRDNTQYHRRHVLGIRDHIQHLRDAEILIEVSLPGTLSSYQ